jgi:NAD(P)H-dependent flavin oxidoreductase YrpB (nitropropane dioxygenase family)
MQPNRLKPATAGTKNPVIIQGGMGVAVSNWVLAKTVSLRGQLGVVSGTAIDSVVVRRLQDGDSGGHVRRAMKHFPFPEIAEDVLKRYFLPEGRPQGQPYKRIPMYTQVSSKFLQSLTVLGNFVEVFLAKEGHDGVIGVNLLTKVQMPNLASLYGAMLAGVNYVLMGAGIPREIPGALDKFAEHQEAAMKFDVAGLGKDETEYLRFDPMQFYDSKPAPLNRPNFLPIIASNSLATMLSKKATGPVQGFVIEGPTAGGHNAPPRGTVQYADNGEPIYGERDEVDLEKIRDIGLPFWVAGGAATPEKVQEVLDMGGAGVQVGTLFAYSKESGIEDAIKREILQKALKGEIKVHTDPRASPTGFPFKVVQLAGTNALEEVYQQRTRVCDLGYLREAYRKEGGGLGYRCASEPVDTYLKKGGELSETTGRKCLCNALMADVGLPQIQKNGEVEKPIITSGDELVTIGRFVHPDALEYSATEVVDYLLSKVGQRVEEDVVAV